MKPIDPARRPGPRWPARFLGAAAALLVAVGGIHGPAFGAADVFIQNGMASCYADRFEGHPTASGETYRRNQLTAAHLTLPFGTRVQITNRANGRRTVVRINDRGPFAEDRILDVSQAAAERLGFLDEGVAEVRLEVLSEEAATASAPPAEPAADRAGHEFYRVQTTPHVPQGFGVQIGSFRELTNLLQAAERLPDSHRRTLTVQVFHIQRVKAYRIIVGEFARREAAEALLSELRETFPDCFIFRF